MINTKNKIIDYFKSGIKNKNPIVAVGHNFYYEGSYNDYGGAELMAKTGSFLGCDMVAMGHQHNFRIVKKKDPMSIYTGSMDKLNFGDSNIDKYFIDYDSLKKKVLFKKVKSRKLVDFHIDLTDTSISDIDDQLIEKIDEVDADDSVVRVRVSVDESAASAVNKDYVERRLYSMGAFFVSKVMIEPVAKRIVRDLTVLNHNNDYDMFKAFVESQNIDDSIKKSILKYSKDIVS